MGAPEEIDDEDRNHTGLTHAAHRAQGCSVPLLDGA
jgi:hypothetical protein